MLPPDGPDSASRRRELIETGGWLMAEEALRRLEPGADLRALRQQRQLLAVWYPPSDAWYYPAFQFDGSGLFPYVAELLAIVPSGNDSGWVSIEWLYSPHVQTHKRPPVELIQSDPQLVLDAAREEFLSSPDSRW